MNCYRYDFHQIREKIVTPLVCLDIKISSGFEGKSMKWTFGTCSSARIYNDFTDYIERCCVAPGKHSLTCLNTENPEGWKGGYLEIQGRRHCDDFMSFKAMRKIWIEGVYLKCYVFSKKKNFLR